MKLNPWWDEWPGLLDYEVGQLEAAGIRFELDGDYLSEHGVVRIHVWPEVDGVEKRMVAYYPDLYPWFRPEVVSPDDDLPKHQAAFSKNLCLLPRDSDAWKPSEDTLAGLLMTQLPLVYESQDSADAAELEVHQAEPFTEYYDKNGVGALVVDSTWDLGGADHGTFEYGLWACHIALGQNAHETQFVGAVLRVLDENGTELASASDAVRSRFLKAHHGRWQRLGGPVKVESPSDARAAVREHPSLAPYNYRRFDGLNVEYEVVGLVFPVEAEYGGASADAWMFIASFAPVASGKQKSLQRRALDLRGESHWIAGQRGGSSDLAVRVPQLGPVLGKNVLVVGTGAIGAPASEHLAQAGANVRMIDSDVIDVGTSVRFPHGYRDAGRFKVPTLHRRLVENWPTTEPDGEVMRVGAPRLSEGGPGQHERLTRLLADADLIFDATGNHAVGLFLSDCAARIGVPLVNVTTTFGCWGGRIMALRPSDGACFDCVYLHVDDRNNEHTPPEERLIPPEQPNGEIRPVGCGDASYTGTSFDAAAVVALGVRAAVALLCDGQDGAYPSMEWNVATVWNRDQDGKPLAGRAFEFTLGRHQDCGECRRRSG